MRLKKLRERLAQLGVATEQRGDSELVVRAVHDEVGDVVVRIQQTEVTVSIGKHFHCHFDIDDNATETWDDVSQFVADVVGDRIVMTVKYHGSKPVQARMDHNETGDSSLVVFASATKIFWLRVLSLFGGRRETIRTFRWSGPFEVTSPLLDSEKTSELANKLSTLSPDQMKELARYLSEKANASSHEE